MLFILLWCLALNHTTENFTALCRCRATDSNPFQLDLFSLCISLICLQTTSFHYSTVRHINTQRERVYFIIESHRSKQPPITINGFIYASKIRWVQRHTEKITTTTKCTYLADSNNVGMKKPSVQICWAVQCGQREWANEKKSLRLSLVIAYIIRLSYEFMASMRQKKKTKSYQSDLFRCPA